METVDYALCGLQLFYLAVFAITGYAGVVGFKHPNPHTEGCLPRFKSCLPCYGDLQDEKSEYADSSVTLDNDCDLSTKTNKNLNVIRLSDQSDSKFDNQSDGHPADWIICEPSPDPRNDVPDPTTTQEDKIRKAIYCREKLNLLSVFPKSNLESCGKSKYMFYGSKSAWNEVNTCIKELAFLCDIYDNNFPNDCNFPEPEDNNSEQEMYLFPTPLTPHIIFSFEGHSPDDQPNNQSIDRIRNIISNTIDTLVEPSVNNSTIDLVNNQTEINNQTKINSQTEINSQTPIDNKIPDGENKLSDSLEFNKAILSEIIRDIEKSGKQSVEKEKSIKNDDKEYTKISHSDVSNVISSQSSSNKINLQTIDENRRNEIKEKIMKAVRQTITETKDEMKNPLYISKFKTE